MPTLSFHIPPINISRTPCESGYLRLARFPAALVLALITLITVPDLASAQASRHAVLIGGLGGSSDHTTQFERYLSETRRGLIEQFGFEAANVTVLGETSIADRPWVETTSTSENIRSVFERLAASVGANDDLYIVLFGHGSFDGTNAQLNIPRRDLNDVDYDELVSQVNARQVVFINTASSSGPFVDALSAPGRIIVTATRSGTERNETTFPRFVVEALSSGSADLDRNGETSVAEVFAFASEQTTRAFADANNLATEHALIDDNGDGKGTEWDKLEGSTDGAVASVTRLNSRSASLAGLSPENRGAASELLSHKERLEIEIAEAKSRKASLSTDEYYAKLEVLFVELARLNNTIEGVGR